MEYSSDTGNREGDQDHHHHHHHHHHSPPWLLITDGVHKEKQYLYSISENRFHHPPANGIPELHDMNVLASRYGWLILADPKTDYTYIWNPISMDKIEIGILKFAFVYEKCVMSKPPSEPDCNIVFYSTDGVCQAFCRLVNAEFVLNLPFPRGYDDDIKLLAAATFRGTIYGFVYPGFRFVVLRFGEETVEYQPILKGDQRPWDLPDPSWEWASYVEDHMIEAEEELLLVHAMYVCKFVADELDFRVFRVDVDRKECVELDSIGDRAIFLSYYGGGFCCCSGKLFRRNCIYYTVEKGKSRSVHVYDLNDRSTTPLLPCPVASRTRSESCWVQNQVFPSITY